LNTSELWQITSVRENQPVILKTNLVLDTFELLLKQTAQNKSTVINIAAANTKKLGVIPVLTIFENLEDNDGAFDFLTTVLPWTYDDK
jgi:hypothetical protein